MINTQIEKIPTNKNSLISHLSRRKNEKCIEKDKDLSVIVIML